MPTAGDRKLLCGDKYTSSCDKAHSGPTQVLDFLYLGSYGDAADYSVLRGLGITHLLNCAGDVQGKQDCAFSRYGGNTGILEHVGFPADDTRHYDILQHLPFSVNFVNAARKRGRKVLVYCVKGVNRSVAICIAYLRQVYGMTFDEALDKVKTNRPHVLTNPGFIEQLQNFVPTNPIQDN